MARNAILSFGLVSVEVSIDKATTPADKDVSYDSASPAGNPVKQVMVDSITGEAVERDDIQKGRFVEDDFRAIDPDLIDQIAEATKGDGVLEVEFLPLADVPMEYATALHFVKPKKGYEAKLAMMAAAMDGTGQAFVTKFVPTTRQSLAVGFVRDGVMYMAQFPFAASRKPVPEAAQLDVDSVDPKLVTQATKLMKGMTNKKAFDEHVDEAVALKADAIQAALDGKPVKKSSKKNPRPKATDDLSALLEESLEAIK